MPALPHDYLLRRQTAFIILADIDFASADAAAIALLLSYDTPCLIRRYAAMRRRHFHILMLPAATPPNVVS